MAYRIYFWMLLIALSWSPRAPAAQAPADEFVAPLQAATPSPRSGPRGPGKIHTAKDALTGEPALQARTMQEAIAAAVGQRAAGCRAVRAGADFGWVITGAAQYPASENQVALRRSRQDARFKAFMDATTRFIGCLSKLTPEAQQRITEVLERNDAIRLALINLAFTDAEKREQAFRILARGYVAYAAEDDSGQRTIYVHLAATPKTATRLTRPAPNAVEAVSLQEGLRQVQAEIRAGLTPRVGNRLIVVNATGELALIGYAINVIGAHPDPTAQGKLRSDAEKIAMNRATEALMGLASGDDSTWQGDLDEVTKNDMQMLNSGYGESEPSVIRFTQIRDLLMAGVKGDAGMNALREGRPPSVAIKRFSGEDAAIVMASYTPLVKKRKPQPAPAAATRATQPTGGAPAPPVKPAPPASQAPPPVPKVEPPPTSAPPSAASSGGDQKIESPPAPVTPAAEPSSDQGAADGAKPAEAR